MKSFTDLGLSSELVKACEKNLCWYDPTKIQREVIPLALQGKNDVFAISPPRTGKVGAFVLPILHALLETGPNLDTFFACVLTTSRLLVSQINTCFIILGSQFGVKSAMLHESCNKEFQANQISKQPHIIVIDDAHLVLNTPFEQELFEILARTRSERSTFLFSPTFTERVHTIQSACLRNPVKIDISSQYSIVDTLQHQRYPPNMGRKVCYLAYTLTERTGRTSVVFTNTWDSSLRLALILKKLGFRAIPVTIYMSQAKKLESLNAFKTGEYNILLCSEISSRGLDIPAVDMVINYDMPVHTNDYMYRVGTTHANAVISFVKSFELK
ncbi:hypothetical protein TSUD_166240 [Trifolium subterraneum]|uniref:Helicase ATP-binding domain-containing protein n=1 Tax=Trifolium subterraneum TaxID=3900 RepID=A0A2Z6MV81_TRISU|nr:hypothetical protein TSUD_166240 [Trifolium subterraneum]